MSNELSSTEKHSHTCQDRDCSVVVAFDIFPAIVFEWLGRIIKDIASLTKYYQIM